MNATLGTIGADYDGLRDPGDIERKEYRYLLGSGMSQHAALSAHSPKSRLYRVKTLYLDTPAGTWSTGVSQTKYRLRQYNDDDGHWYFEQKRNVGGAVGKHREQISPDAVDQLGLRPVMLVTYDRTEYQFPPEPGSNEREGFRATMDQNVHVHHVDRRMPPSMAMRTPQFPHATLQHQIFETKSSDGQSPTWLPVPQEWPGSKSRWGLAALKGVANMWAPTYVNG